MYYEVNDMREQIRWLFVILGLLGIAILVSPSTLQADSSFGGAGVEGMSSCTDMPEVQIQGYTQGAACRVPVRSVAGEGTLAPMLELYRSGWTNRVASESDSDLVEDKIKVEGFLYWVISGEDFYETWCEDPRTWSTHASCRTSTSGSGSWHQNGRHYFQTAGYVDDNFQTDDYWTS